MERPRVRSSNGNQPRRVPAELKSLLGDFCNKQDRAKVLGLTVAFPLIGCAVE